MIRLLIVGIGKLIKLICRILYYSWQHVYLLLLYIFLSIIQWNLLRAKFGYLIGYDTSMYLGLFWPIIKYIVLGIIASKNNFEPNQKLIYKKNLGKIVIFGFVIAFIIIAVAGILLTNMEPAGY